MGVFSGVASIAVSGGDLVLSSAAAALGAVILDGVEIIDIGVVGGAEVSSIMVARLDKSVISKLIDW